LCETDFMLITWTNSNAVKVFVTRLLKKQTYSHAHTKRKGLGKRILDIKVTLNAHTKRKGLIMRILNIKVKPCVY
jgi:hypothetical protein